MGNSVKIMSVYDDASYSNCRACDLSQLIDGLSKHLVFVVLLPVCTKEMVENCKSYMKNIRSNSHGKFLMGNFSWEISHGKFSVDGPSLVVFSGGLCLC